LASKDKGKIMISTVLFKVAGKAAIKKMSKKQGQALARKGLKANPKSFAKATKPMTPAQRAALKKAISASANARRGRTR